MDDFKFYEVGGKIRDELLGLTNKDVDYVAVPTEAVYSKIHPCEAQLSPARLMFKALKSYLEEQKFEIFLVTPLDPVVTFDDDPLRIIRGVRFAVTKGFDFSDEVHSAIENYDYYTKMKVVSEDRIREELLKCFKYDTHATLMWLFLVGLDEYIFNETGLSQLMRNNGNKTANNL